MLRNHKPNLQLSFFLTLILILGLALSLSTHALVIANAAMTVDNLRFSSSDTNAELFWTDVWRGDVLAFAQDTLSGVDSEDAEQFGDDASLEVDATTALAGSLAMYNVSNGPGVAKGDGNIEAITGTGLEIDGITAQASGETRGTFDNFFTVLGGNLGDTVDVTFELDFVYLLDALADDFGYFEVFVFANLEIQDLDDLFDDVDSVDNLLQDFVLRTEEGTATSIFELISGTLTLNATLEYGKEYYLFGAADSEAFGTNTVPVSVPPTWLLGFYGLLLWSTRPPYHSA